jgi:hypothetical protein
MSALVDIYVSFFQIRTIVDVYSAPSLIRPIPIGRTVITIIVRGTAITSIIAITTRASIITVITCGAAVAGVAGVAIAIAEVPWHVGMGDGGAGQQTISQ